MDEHKVASNKSKKASKNSKKLASTQSDVTPVRSHKSNPKDVKSLPLMPQGSPPSEAESSVVKDDTDLLDATINLVSAGEESPHIEDFTSFFCKLLAEDLWEAAWETCEERFFHQHAPKIITSNLRDAWLAIVEMEYMDTDTIHMERVQIPTYADTLPLPPKVDFWAHGALELLPRSCRESVMDPFLREPMPWFLEKYADDNQQVPQSFQSSTSSIIPSKVKDLSNVHLERPVCAVPSTSEEEDNEDEESTTWSIASTGGSFSLSSLIKTDRNAEHLISPPISAATLASAAQFDSPKTQSLQLIYPTKYPKAEIKSSSEIAYINRFGSSGYKKSQTVDGPLRASETVAFKLPNQTSSKAQKEHQERKLRPTVANSTTSSSSRKN